MGQTKQEFLARMQRDIDDGTDIGCYVITGEYEANTVMLTGIGGTPMGVMKFATRVLKAVAKRLGQEPKTVAGAIEMLLELGGPEKSIEVDADAIAAAAGKREDDDDDK